MERKIVVSALLNQVQIGIVEYGRLVEYYLERSHKERLVSNIYKGRVENILPGMNAAFVDIGMNKNAFLFLPDLRSEQAQKELKIGDSILVQVAKEAEGSKGARVTTEISLPGRYLVLMPFQNHTGISKQIVDDEERARLKEIAEEICPANMGIIVRTVAEGCLAEELKEDLEDLLGTWARIEKKYRGKNKSPLLYEDNDLIYRILRDLYAPENTKILVSSADLKKRVVDGLQDLGLSDVSNIEVHQGKLDIFTALGLGQDLQRARNNRVWLDCGGYLVFNQTEALLSIDVNTGKYVGSTDLQDTVLRTNLQAAKEVAYQLRLRNIGGIVIIDFIDMSTSANRDQVLAELAKHLATDRTRTNLLGFTRLGLVELTRKKARRLLSNVLEVDCPYCHGTGRVSSDETVAFEIALQVHSLAIEKNVEAILVRCHSAVAAQLIGPSASNLEALEKQTGKTIFVRGDDTFGRGEHELESGTSAEISQKAYPVQVGDRLAVAILEPHANKPGSGLARVEGFVIECLNARSFVGQTKNVEIIELHKTSAVARLVN